MGHWLGQRLGYGTGLRSVQRLGKWLGHGTRHGLKWLKWLKWLNWLRSWRSWRSHRTRHGLRHWLSGLGSRLRHWLSGLDRLSGVLRHRLSRLRSSLGNRSSRLNWLNSRLRHRLNSRLRHWLSNWLRHWLNSWLRHWLSNWLRHWLSNWLRHWLHNRLSRLDRRWHRPRRLRARLGHEGGLRHRGKLLLRRGLHQHLDDRRRLMRLRRLRALMFQHLVAGSGRLLRLWG